MDATMNSNGANPSIIETTENGDAIYHTVPVMSTENQAPHSSPQGPQGQLLRFDDATVTVNPAQNAYLGIGGPVIHVKPTSSLTPEVDIARTSIAVIVPQSTYEPLPYSTSRSGLVYDVRMAFHQLLPSVEDPNDMHPEQPNRIKEIFKELMEAGLVAGPNNSHPDDDHQLLRIQIRSASKDEVELVHSDAHIALVASLENLSVAELQTLTNDADSVYYHNLTFISASLAAGGAIEAARAVVAGQVRNSIAIIRPPGHHAEHDHPSGFCFFNNVAVAAKVVQRDFPELCRKVLILDWDVHHGNGIQQAFERDPNVLYISLHVHRNGNFYPLTDYGDHLHCGEGPGRGKNVNIPWSTSGMTDADYMLAFQQIVMPIAAEFDPDLVFISAGFDAAQGDPLGECHVSPAGFAHMTFMLKQLARGKVVACLEGGYNLRSIARSAVAMTRTLMGEPPERLGELTPTPSAVATIQLVIRTQAPFWKCLYPKALDISLKKELGSERLHDIVREWQSKVLWDNYNMTSLFIRREKLSKSFENQVLATPDYHEDRPLLVIFHDPPDVLGYPEAATGQLELHNTWLTDGSKTYVDWAVKHDFAVIDVNIPRYTTAEEDDEGYVDADPEQKRATTTKELASYLWDNYIQLSDSPHIIFLGIGEAYAGITQLLSKHRSCIDRITLTVIFVANNTMRAVQSDSDDSIARKYHNKSLIFIHPEHPYLSKKLKKRYGNVKASEKKTLKEMLHVHRMEVFERLLNETEGWREENGKVQEGTRGKMDLDAVDELAVEVR